MKRFFNQLLIIVMILGLAGFSPALASDYEGHYYENAISYVVENDLWTAGENFGPDEPATRAQVASVMARFLSDLTPPFNKKFSDVSEDNFYATDITLAANLGLVTGDGGVFRPDDLITREEFAILLVRATDMAGCDINDTKYLTELMKDYDNISAWAKDSVVKALGNGLFLSQNRKMFNPKGSVTRAELANAVYDLYLKGNFAPAYTEEKVTDPDLTGFTLINTFNYVNRGIGGFGVIARFDGGPGQIYVKRKKCVYTANSANNQAAPVTFVKVSDPNGNVICRVDIDWLDEGIMEKMINIPEGPAGIYQIQINNGVMRGHFINNAPNMIDEYTVGIKGEKSWGFRGEDAIVIKDGTLPTEGYIYVPEKIDFLTIGTAGGGWTMGNGTTFTLYNEDKSKEFFTQTSNGQGIAVGYAMTTINANPSLNAEGTPVLEGGKAYPYSIKATVPSKMVLRIGMTGITPVIYPNKEYALDLKSGYIMHTDEYATLQLAGPLQKRARERMVEIYNELNGDFTVDVSDTKLTKIPADADNLIAEAQLFGAYGGSLNNVRGSIDLQCTDPSNPYFGAIISRNQVKLDTDGDGELESYYPEWTGELKPEDYPFYSATATTERNWQTGYYTISSNTPFSGALSINSELNPFYNHPVLKKRAELVMLHLATQASADGLYVYSTNKNNAISELHTYEQFYWGDHGLAQAYYYVRDFLSPETRYITDISMLNETDRLMDFRGMGPSNQLIMAMNATAWTYAWTGSEIYHEQLKRQVMGMTAPAVYDAYHGQAKLGYFIESGGSDGSSYGKMCEGLWSGLAYIYLSLPESMQDPQLKADIVAAENLFLLWDSMWQTPATAKFSNVASANWTSRVNSGWGLSPVDGNKYLKNIFPRAKKNMLVANYGLNYPNYKSLTAKPGRQAYVVTEAQAKNLITYYNALPRVDSYSYVPATCNVTDGTCLHYEKKGLGHGGLPEAYRGTNSPMYYVNHEEQQFDDSEMPILPYEQEGDYNFVMNENGIVTVKHKGLYMICYFNNSMPGTKISSKSWMGGGPTTIWDDYFATTIHSSKPVEYDRFTGEGTADYTNAFAIDDIRHSCILGTAANGKLFVSGKEKATFSWLEKNKSFQLTGVSKAVSGDTTIHNKTVTWKYYLTDKGIAIDGGVENIKSDDDLYMQVPILVQKGANYTFDEENHRIVIEHGGNQIVYRWKEGADVTLGAASTESTTANCYKYLRIKITQAQPFANLWIERTMAS